MRGAEGWHSLDFSDLLWGGEDICSLNLGEQLPELGGGVVLRQGQS